MEHCTLDIFANYEIGGGGGQVSTLISRILRKEIHS